tara:strand:+ start:5322 stop:6689 length:1368 start_codon:yes stop_codon:yes gene_type:complete
MNSCYLCDAPLEDHIDANTANHVEHIIQQAIGGQLTATGLLCKECGGEKYLGGQIDKPFTELFSLITERLDIKKDRKAKPISLKGKLSPLNSVDSIDVYLRDNVLTHRKPEYKIDHENKVAYVYANKTVVKKFKKKVEDELKKVVANYSDYKIKEVTDLSSLDEFIGLLELPFNIDNKTFEAGMVKIAIEFALSRGIGISHLNHLIDRANRTIRSENIVMPYYPVIKVEEVIEYLRTTIDLNFMSHSIVLFSQRQVHPDDTETKQLYCFIELFGTFQHIVRLNDNYTGTNIEPITYAQRIIRQPNTQLDIGKLSPKEISIYANELGFSLSDFKGMTENAIRRLIENTFNKRNKYVFDYRSNIETIVNRILRDTILNRDTNMIQLIPDVLSHFYRDVDKDEFHIELFRSRYFKDNSVHSIIPDIFDLYQTDIDKFRRYTYFKFKELEDYININKTM